MPSFTYSFTRCSSQASGMSWTTVAAALMAEWTVVAGVEALAAVVVDLDLKQSTG